VIAMADIDPGLLQRTKDLGGQFDAAATRLMVTHDLRIFFTFAHGYITKKIGKHIGLFAAPNPLMRLNDMFATTFLAAINGAPHEGWERAFKVCAGLAKAENAGFVEFLAFAPMSFEVCGGCMAKIHITRDLKDALTKERGVDAQDYGNILIFVNEGHLYAEKMIRGAARAALMVMTSWPVMEKLNMNARVWRNQAFQDAYGKSVPEPDKAFIAAYHRGEGR
jgi:hypothetical protein